MTIAIISWLYYSIGAYLLIFRGENIHRPAARLKAWALWPFRHWPNCGNWNGIGYSEREFYSLPIEYQRRLLGLRDGQNPSAPTFFKRPEPVRMPKPGDKP